MSYKTIYKTSNHSFTMSWANKVRKLQKEDGEISEDEDVMCVRSLWADAMALLSKGAKWGDIECYAKEDIGIYKPLEKKQVAKPYTCQNCFTDCEEVLKKYTYGKVCLECFHSIIAPPEPVKLQQCKGCTFHVHTSPPADFTPEQRLFCCTVCQQSRGKTHGGRCQKGNPNPAPYSPPDLTSDFIASFA